MGKNRKIIIGSAFLVISIISLALSYKTFYKCEFNGSFITSIDTFKSVKVSGGHLIVNLNYFPRSSTALKVAVIEPDGTEVNTKYIYPPQVYKWDSATLDFLVQPGEYHIKFECVEKPKYYWHVNGNFYNVSLGAF